MTMKWDLREKGNKLLCEIMLCVEVISNLARVLAILEQSQTAVKFQLHSHCFSSWVSYERGAFYNPLEIPPLSYLLQY